MYVIKLAHPFVFPEMAARRESYSFLVPLNPSLHACINSLRSNVPYTAIILHGVSFLSAYYALITIAKSYKHIQMSNCVQSVLSACHNVCLLSYIC